MIHSKKQSRQVSHNLIIGVLVSGRGTNLQQILDEVESGRLHASVSVVISNCGSAEAISRAKARGIPAIFIDPKAYTASHVAWCSGSAHRSMPWPRHPFWGYIFDELRHKILHTPSSTPKFNGCQRMEADVTGWKKALKR